jgi:hypothetical protein
MESKLISGLYCSKPNVEWKKVSLGVKVDAFIKQLNDLKSQVSDSGFINIDVCVSKDGQKLYAVLNDYKPEKQPQVSASQHSPDRETDLPF